MQPSILNSRIESLRAGNQVLLDRTEFSAVGGKVTILLGESGAGKTSLLRAILGWHGPTLAGTTAISIEGASIDVRSLRLAGRIGYVAQDAGLFPWMDVRDILALPRKLNSDLQGFSEQECLRLLQEVHLGREVLEKRVSDLSFGMRQRVVLLRALLHRPQLLLVDELFTGLDRATGMSLGAILLNFVESANTICVAATHDWFQASLVARSAILIDRRKLSVVPLNGEYFHNTAPSLGENKVSP